MRSLSARYGLSTADNARLFAMVSLAEADGAIGCWSSRFPTQPRHFERFSQALQEVVDARVWGGIHFRTADTQGALLGKKVARWERRHYFQPTRMHSHEHDD